MSQLEQRQPDPLTLIRILKKIPFFAGLQDFEYKALLNICRILPQVAGTALFYAGEPGHQMFLILSGKIEIRTPKGMINCVLGPGEVIGEVALVMTLAKRSANAVVMEESVLLAISREDVEALLSRAPRVSYLIMRNVAEVLAERMIANNRRLDGY
jgi:CRP-like cAMP-binding protein